MIFLRRNVQLTITLTDYFSAPESKLHPIQYYSPQYSHQKYPTSSCSSQCCGLRHQSKKSSTINKLCCSTTKKSDFSTTKKSESSTTKQLGTSSTTKKLGSSTKASYHHTTDKSADITPQVNLSTSNT